MVTWHWHVPCWGRRESPDPRRGALWMQTLGMQPQASPSWSGSVLHPLGDRGIPREGDCSTQRERQHHEEPNGATRADTAAAAARGTSPGTGHSSGARKGPALVPWAPLGQKGGCSSCHPRCRQGDQWVPRTARTGRVQGDLQSTKNGLVPLLVPGLGNTSGSPSSSPHTVPDPHVPGEGDCAALPSLTAAAGGGRCSLHTHTSTMARVPAQGAALLQEKVPLDSVPGW